MNEKTKSASTFISDMVSKFDYLDFKPPITTDALRKRFEEIVIQDTPYWSPWVMPESWQKAWTAVEVRSFKNHDHVRVAFAVRANSIGVAVFNGIHGSNFAGTFIEFNIDLNEAWQDHGSLDFSLKKVLLPAIKFANRQKQDDPYPKN